LKIEKHSGWNCIENESDKISLDEGREIFSETSEIVFKRY